MFSVSEAEDAAIRDAYERGDELAAAVELRRYVAGIDSTAKAGNSRALSPAGNRRQGC